MRVKEVAADAGERTTSLSRDRAAMRVQRLANLELVEVLPKRMDPAVFLRRLRHPLLRDAAMSTVGEPCSAVRCI